MKENKELVAVKWIVSDSKEKITWAAKDLSDYIASAGFSILRELCVYMPCERREPVQVSRSRSPTKQ